MINARRMYIDNVDFDDDHYPIYADAFSDEDWAKSYYKNFDRCDQFEWYSYIYWRRKACEGDYVNINQNGIRKTWNASDGDSDSFRIFMFGGSTMWGSGAEDNGTIPSHLSQSLSQYSDKKVHITNFGESGYVFTQELVLLMLELKKGNIPDMVVIYSGVNETVSSFQNKQAGIPSNEKNRRIEFNSRKRANVTNIINKSGVYRVAKKIGDKLIGSSNYYDYSNALPQNLVNDTVEVYKNNIGIVDKLSEIYGFETLYYWQPVIFTKPKLSLYEQKEEKKYGYYKSFYLDTYSRVENDSMLNQHGRFRNISNIFENDSNPYFTDSVHIRCLSAKLSDFFITQPQAISALQPAPL